MSAARKKPQLSRHVRGYTNAHVARRRQLEPLVATGPGRLLPLQRAHPAWTALASRPPRRPPRLPRPSHATCNLRAAAEKTNGKRKDHPLIWSRVWFEPIPPNVALSGNVDVGSTRDTTDLSMHHPARGRRC